LGESERENRGELYCAGHPYMVKTIDHLEALLKTQTDLIGTLSNGLSSRIQTSTLIKIAAIFIPISLLIFGSGFGYFAKSISNLGSDITFMSIDLAVVKTELAKLNSVSSDIDKNEQLVRENDKRILRLEEHLGITEMKKK
jgi:hypothetical protein